MITDKIRKRTVICVERGDHSRERSETRSRTDAIGRASLAIYNLLKDVDLKPGDSIILDIGMVIRHADNHNRHQVSNA